MASGYVVKDGGGVGVDQDLDDRYVSSLVGGVLESSSVSPYEGYVRFTNGITFQWGVGSAAQVGTGRSIRVDYPIPFTEVFSTGASAMSYLKTWTSTYSHPSRELGTDMMIFSSDPVLVASTYDWTRIYFHALQTDAKYWAIGLTDTGTSRTKEKIFWLTLEEGNSSDRRFNGVDLVNDDVELNTTPINPSTTLSVDVETGDKIELELVKQFSSTGTVQDTYAGLAVIIDGVLQPDYLLVNNGADSGQASYSWAVHTEVRTIQSDALTAGTKSVEIYGFGYDTGAQSMDVTVNAYRVYA